LEADEHFVLGSLRYSPCLEKGQQEAKVREHGWYECALPWE
jgi:hypothetical protein